jgi:4-amino-4-deoxy-L-arabinose transferase-like glycosyltransferase
MFDSGSKCGKWRLNLGVESTQKSSDSVITLGGSTTSIRAALFDRQAMWVFVLALVLRLAWVISVQISHPGDAPYLQGDAIEYTGVAHSLLSGKGWWSPDRGGIPYPHGPLFPLFVAAILAAGGSLFTVTIVQAFVGALTCWGMVRVGRRLTSPRAAVAAGFLTAIYPYFLHYTSLVLTETLGVFFGLAIFITLLDFSREPRPRTAVASGIVLGIATLNHPETYVAPALLPLWVFAFHRYRRVALLLLVPLLVCFGLTLLPWHAYHALRYGKNVFLPPALGAGGILGQGAFEARGRILRDPNYYKQDLPELNEKGIALEKEHGKAGGVAIALGEVARDFAEHPVRYGKFVVLKFWRMWGLAPEAGAYHRPLIDIPVGALNALLYLACLAGLRLYRRRGEAALAVTIILVYTLPHLLFFAQPRYRLPAMPVVILFAAVGMGLALEWFSERRSVAGRALTDARQ